MLSWFHSARFPTESSQLGASCFPQNSATTYGAANGNCTSVFDKHLPLPVQRQALLSMSVAW